MTIAQELYDQAFTLADPETKHVYREPECLGEACAVARFVPGKVSTQWLGQEARDLLREFLPMEAEDRWASYFVAGWNDFNEPQREQVIHLLLEVADYAKAEGL